MMSNNFKTNGRVHDRSGTIAVLFAIILPVLLVMAAIAINIAQMQMTRTELKIATDAAARGGGRAWSEFQDLDVAKDYARQAAQMNTVGGMPLTISVDEADGEIVFGESLQQGTGRFNFSPLSESEILDGELASGVRVSATQSASLFFQIGSVNSFSPSVTSVASQTDRDIALVIDRSGSMVYFEGQDTDLGKGEDYLYDTITALYNDSSNGISKDEYDLAVADYQGANVANGSLNDRQYSDNIIDLLSGDLKAYAQTLNSQYRPRTGAPLFSRWHMLEQANAAFFEVLDQTVQMELVSVASFASSAQVDVTLTDDIEVCETAVEGLMPSGATAIGDGMLEAYDSLVAFNSRPSAIKTLIVFSDGVNNTGTSPAIAAQQIIEKNPNVVIHTVTFGAGDINSMKAVADLTTGVHRHADNGDELIEIFRELAASMRTVITE